MVYKSWCLYHWLPQKHCPFSPEPFRLRPDIIIKGKMLPVYRAGLSRTSNVIVAPIPSVSAASISVRAEVECQARSAVNALHNDDRIGGDRNRNAEHPRRAAG
jgi:hypothetical protein